MQRRILLGIVMAAVLVVAVLAVCRKHAASDRTPTTTTTPGESRTGSTAAEPPMHVRRLSREERRRLGEQVAAAIARRSASASAPTSAGTSAPPELPTFALEDAGPELQTALKESIALLADCYKQQGSAGARTATAMMVMTSDPDFGTVIDTDRITDGDGAPLDPALETCLRDAIDTLALPPLGKAGRLPLQYTFRFD